MKSWKSLFVKDEEENSSSTQPSTTNVPSFPVHQTTNYTSMQGVAPQVSAEVEEVMKVYESGLDSINMPGYDFYEFYKAVQMALPYNEQTFNMAYQMAKTMDATVSVPKLIQDAEFYISKINEVHSQYVTQGQQKLSQISEKRMAEKMNLTKVIDNNAMRIAQLKAELTQLESEIQTKRATLAKIDESYAPQEQTIKQKLNANDLAKTNSVAKITLVRDSIQKFIKNN